MQQARTTLSQLGELGLISRIRSRVAVRPDVATGIGDDCAVVRMSGDGADDLVLKSDPVISGRHFLADTPPELVGRKAAGRVLSDIAAMGAVPRWFLVDLVAPGSTEVDYIDAVFAGINAMSREYGFALIGGDTCRGEELQLHVFGCGTVPRGTARLRSGACAGDSVRVTGKLGGSLASGKHLDFRPRVREGQWLRDVANAMIDISDGLASELWHIAHESNVAISVDAPKIPVSQSASGSRNPLASALHDGEDFELLFTVPQDRETTFDTEWTKAFPDVPCTCIGRVAAAGAADVKFSDGTSLPERGFDHFVTD